MIRKELVICNRLGLHARAAAKLVQAASKFKARVILSTNQMSADAKSILGVLTLAASKDTPVVLEVDGADEGAAVEELEGLILGRFGEE